MANIAKLVRRKLGEILLEEGLVSEEQVQQALERQKRTGELLGEALIELAAVTEMDIARAICKQFGLPYLDSSRYQIAKDVSRLVPPETMLRNRFVVFDKIGKTLLVATSGVIDAKVFEDLEKSTGLGLTLYVSTFSQVANALRRLYPDAVPENGKPKAE